METPSHYDLKTLNPALASLGYRLLYRAEVESTMPIVEAHILSGNEERLVALTDQQTKGVGSKQGRVWMSSARKAIMFSAALKADPQDLSKLQDMVALKAAIAIQETTGIEDLKLKWPNDFVIDDKKTGGMMVPTIFAQTPQGPIYVGSNLGLGLNVHYSQADIDELSPLTDYGTTALDLHTQNPNNRQEILIGILDSISHVHLEASWVDKNTQVTQDLNNKWRKLAAILGRNILAEFFDDEPSYGKVLDTQIGKGILLEAKSGRSDWINAAGLKKVRLTND